MSAGLKELRAIDTRLDTVATKKDLEVHARRRKVLIAEAVDPLRDEVHEIDHRLRAVELGFLDAVL